MAVISIGCDLEKKAIAYYKEHAAKTDDPELKQLFTWLVEWEEGHLDQLRELEQQYQTTLAERDQLPPAPEPQEIRTKDFRKWAKKGLRQAVQRHKQEHLRGSIVPNQPPRW